MDGRVETSWLAADGEEGFVEIVFRAPRRIESIRLLNTSNAPHHDRATRDYHVELWGPDDAMVRQVRGSMPFKDTPEWIEHAVGVEGVQRIRFVVENHHRLGSGLSELAWR